MPSKLTRAAFGTFAVLSLLFLTSSSALAQSANPFTRANLTPLTRGLDFGVALPSALLAVDEGAGAAAQANTQVRQADAGIGFGIIYGIVYPAFSSDDFPNISNKTGWKLGIFFGGNRDGTVGFWGKLLYKVKKGAYFNEISDFEAKYLDIPFGFRVNVGSASRNSVVGFVDVGAIVSINVSKLDDANIAEDYLGTELGYYFGFGIEVTRLIVEFRWDRMVRSFYDPGDGFAPIRGHEFEIEFMFRIN